ncbi:DUF1801 domain-containing protein [Actinomadura latina]|uniref:DUF1801 domain-containing protein n=1 Tax=Actinomadura latina TaxID=163603 RepID=A0A846YY35_9ACTN|nr:DUF1801 domain-containing protein [Actinomadura latina]NKZ03525.1 DUF1801 domain-containing protein [Actinomadura latina]
MGKHANVREYMADVPAGLRDVAEKALAVVDAALPGVEVALWHAQPTWSLGEKAGQKPVCFIKAYAKYVTFGLWRGQEIEDASGRLEAMSRQMAGVKLSGLEDVDEELFAGWVRRARALEE